MEPLGHPTYPKVNYKVSHESPSVEKDALKLFFSFCDCNLSFGYLQLDLQQCVRGSQPLSSCTMKKIEEQKIMSYIYVMIYKVLFKQPVIILRSKYVILKRNPLPP